MKTKTKLLTFFTLLLSSLVIFTPASVYATNSNNHSHSNRDINTRVRGNVYDQSIGQPINGLTVSVTCNGITKTDNTDSFGLYEITFTKAECDKFDPVSATATYHGETQSMTVLVSSTNTATMDLNFGAVEAPEFGIMGGIISAVGSGIAYLGMRKKITS